MDQMVYVELHQIGLSWALADNESPFSDRIQHRFNASDISRFTRCGDKNLSYCSRLRSTHHRRRNIMLSRRFMRGDKIFRHFDGHRAHTYVDCVFPQAR